MIVFEDEDNKISRKNSNVLIEKYRPLSVKGVILPPKFQKMFAKFIEEQEIQNLLFYSNSPGVGKTTMAKALANDCNYEYRYINTSLYGGIDTLRSEIAQFATTKALSGKRKLVILDEFDGATDNLQKALKGAIEEYYDSCRFILTANSINKIIKPLQSRCQPINFDFTDKDKKILSPKIVKRLETIATKEDIPFEAGIMSKIVDVFYPDIRKMINTVSEYSRQYDMIDEKIFNFSIIDDELTDIIVEGVKVKEARQYILNHNYKYEDLYRHVFDEVIPKVQTEIKGDLYKLTADYLDMATRSWDQEITFTGFLISMMEIIRGDEG